MSNEKKTGLPQGPKGSRIIRPEGAEIINIEVHRRPDPKLPPISESPSYACPNCGSKLRTNFSCPNCPTWARPPGLRPFPPTAA